MTGPTPRVPPRPADRSTALELLHGFAVEGVDGQMAAVGAAKFLDPEASCDRDRPDREIGRFAGLHADDHAVVQGCPGAEAAFLVVADEDELREPPLLETRQDVAADSHPAAGELLDPRREPVAGEGLVLRQIELDVVERDLTDLLVSRWSGCGGGGRQRRMIGSRRGWRAGRGP
jgi:hypothetical protein